MLNLNSSYGWKLADKPYCNLHALCHVISFALIPISDDSATRNNANRVASVIDAFRLRQAGLASRDASFIPTASTALPQSDEDMTQSQVSLSQSAESPASKRPRKSARPGRILFYLMPNPQAKFAYCEKQIALAVTFDCVGFIKSGLTKSK